jgi:hypothetical protein
LATGTFTAAATAAATTTGSTAARTAAPWSTAARTAAHLASTHAGAASCGHGLASLVEYRPGIIAACRIDLPRTGRCGIERLRWRVLQAGQGWRRPHREGA